MNFLIQVLAILSFLKFLGWLDEPIALWAVGSYLVAFGIISFLSMALQSLAKRNAKRATTMPNTAPLSAPYSQVIDPNLQAQLEELHKKKFGG